MLKEALETVLAGQRLGAEMMARVVGEIMDGDAEPVLTAALLVALRMQGETADELTGAATAMRARMMPVRIARRPLLDTCGTGGSGTGRFNISTTVAIVAATAGVAVAKHGNRAASSRSGSADVLAACGVNLDASPDVVAQCVEELGVGFLFAPAHHPAMRHAGPIRKALGVRTLFNLLGPLTNPAGATRQVLGVFAPQWVRPMAETLGRLGSERAWVVHGAGGLDEISLEGPTLVAEWDGHRVQEWQLNPRDLGIARAPVSALAGGSPEENAQRLRDILAGSDRGPLTDAVALNTAAALAVAKDVPLNVALDEAQQILASGAALATLDELVRATRG